MYSHLPARFPSSPLLSLFSSSSLAPASLLFAPQLVHISCRLLAASAGQRKEEQRWATPHLQPLFFTTSPLRSPLAKPFEATAAVDGVFRAGRRKEKTGGGFSSCTCGTVGAVLVQGTAGQAPHLLVCRCCVEALLVRSDVPPEPRLPPPNRLQRHLLHPLRHPFQQPVKGIIAVLTSVPLRRSPEVLDAVKLAVKLREEDTLVTCFFHHLFHRTLLLPEVGLRR